MAVAPRSNPGVLDDVMSRRIVFVAGKGGSGKTSIAAALCLLGARRGKRVLGIEVDAKGDLAGALGSQPVGFEPEVVQTRISVLALHPEDSLREYMKVFFKVPRMVGLTPLARIFDFVATSVPGPKDMLTIGKIAYEEQRETRGTTTWDLIVVDCTASGHALAQIMAAREMMKITRGGMIKGQLEWVDAIVGDRKKSTLVITSLPEEMPVVEAQELYAKAEATQHIGMAACFLNRMPPPALDAAQHRVLAALTTAGRRAAVDKRLDGSVAPFRDGIELAESIRGRAEVQAKALRESVAIPVVEVPLLVAKRGLATSRAMANAIAEATA